MTYRLTTPEREAALVPGGAPAIRPPYIRVANPISAERVVMRQTLMPGLLEVMAQNGRLRDRLWFFEIGPVYLPAGSAELPREPRRLAIGVAGRLAPASWREADPCRVDFFDLKGVVEASAGLHSRGVSSRQPIRPSRQGGLPGSFSRQ
jgi:phenylalanyl-tRNA synthetase beta chain